MQATRGASLGHRAGIAGGSARHRGGAEHGGVASAVPLPLHLEAVDLDARRAWAGGKCGRGYGATVFEGRARRSAPRLRHSLNCAGQLCALFACGCEALWDYY